MMQARAFAVTVSGSPVNVVQSLVRTPPVMPPIFFESGSGADLTVWEKVIESVSCRFSYIAYDRPGIGRSAEIAGPRDPISMARGAAALLDALHVREPVIIVAHSLGTMIARCLLLLAPERIAGLVLLDPVHEDMHRHLAPANDPGLPNRLVRRAATGMRVAELLARAGLLRVMFALRPAIAWSLGLTGRGGDNFALLSKPARWRDMRRSLLDFETGAQSLRGQRLRPTPCIVLTAVGQDNAMRQMSAQPYSEFVPRWRALHDDIAAGLGGIREDVVSAHAIHLAAPDRVVEAIDRIAGAVVKARKG